MPTHNRNRNVHPNDSGPGANAAIRDFRNDPHQAVRTMLNASRHAALGSLGVAEEEADRAAAVAANLRGEIGADAASTSGNHCPIVSRRPATTRHQLIGSARVTRNVTSTHPAAPLQAGPNAIELAGLLLGEHLAHDLLAHGVPDALADQAVLYGCLLDHALETEDRGYNKLDRRRPMFAEGAARYLVTEAQPTALTFARSSQLLRWYVDTLDQVHDLGTHDPAQPATVDAAEDRPSLASLRARISFLRRERIVWADPDGIRHGLLLDRFHHAYRAGVVARDAWTRHKVTEDLHAAAAFLVDGQPELDPTSLERALLGVRVLTPLASKASVHFLPKLTQICAIGEHGEAAPVGYGLPGDRAVSGALRLGGTLYLLGIGGYHAVGGCEHCSTTAHLPNASTGVPADFTASATMDRTAARA